MSIDLHKFVSHCGRTQKSIVSTDRGSPCEHRAENRRQNNVRQYRIDGEVIPKTAGSRCDWLLLNDDKNDAYLIELKGSDIHWAIQQIESTYRQIKSSLNNDCHYYYRIIYHTGTQRVRDPATIRWKESHRGDAVIRSRHYTDYIS